MAGMGTGIGVGSGFAGGMAPGAGAAGMGYIDSGTATGTGVGTPAYIGSAPDSEGSPLGQAEAMQHDNSQPTRKDKAEGAVHKMEDKTGTQNMPTNPATGTATGVGGGLGTAEAMSHGSTQPTMKDKAMAFVHKVQDKVTGHHQ